MGKWFTTQDGSNRRLRLIPFYTNSLPLEASQKMTIRCSLGFMSNSCWAAPLSLPSSQPRILRQVIQNRWQLHVGRLETFCLNFICVLMNLISVFFWHSEFDLFELWFQTAPGWAEKRISAKWTSKSKSDLTNMEENTSVLIQLMKLCLDPRSQLHLIMIFSKSFKIRSS